MAKRSAEEAGLESDLVRETSAPSISTPAEPMDLAASFSVKAGSRLEVLWNLEYEERGEVVETWWPCTVSSKTDKTHELTDEEGCEGESQLVSLWAVNYDALPDFDYSGEDLCSEVAFVAEHGLLEVTSDTLLPWRIEGQQWDPPEGSEDEDASESTVVDDFTVIPLNAGTGLPEAIEQIVQNVVGKAIEATGDKMASLPFDAQHQVADLVSHARELFATAIKAQLEETGMNEFRREHVASVLEKVAPQLEAMRDRLRNGQPVL